MVGNECNGGDENPCITLGVDVDITQNSIVRKNAYLQYVSPSKPRDGANPGIRYLKLTVIVVNWIKYNGKRPCFLYPQKISSFDCL